MCKYDIIKIYDDEIFKNAEYPDIIPGRYIISNYGRMFFTETLSPKKFFLDKDGYRRTSITIIKDGKSKAINVGIHRLVAYTFLNKNKNTNVVNHIDGRKCNNYYKNLEWTTPLENTRHAIRTGLQCNSGPNCPSAIYSEETVRKICKMLEDGFDASEIYKYFKNDDIIKDKAFYMLIFSIKSGTRHRTISKEYNIPRKVASKQHPKFTQKEIDKISELIDKGYRNIEIVHEFTNETSKMKTGKRYYDKIQEIRKRKAHRLSKPVTSSNITLC